MQTKVDRTLVLGLSAAFHLVSVFGLDVVPSDPTLLLSEALELGDLPTVVVHLFRYSDAVDGLGPTLSNGCAEGISEIFHLGFLGAVQ